MNRTLNLTNIICLCLITCVTLLSGCVHAPQIRKPVDPAIAPILSGLSSQNSTIHSFNGIGNITITDQYRVNNFRLAWAGKCPDQIKMIVLFSGNPVETLATDGEYLYIKSHNNRHPFILNKVKNPSLEFLTKFPVTTEQIISYLAGHIPVLSYDYATIERKPEKKDTVITLMKSGKTIEVLYLDEKNRVKSLEVIESDNIRYNVTFEASGDNDLLFPSLVQASQGDRSIIIRIEKNTPNPDLPPETFRIPKE